MKSLFILMTLSFSASSLESSNIDHEDLITTKIEKVEEAFSYRTQENIFISDIGSMICSLDKVDGTLAIIRGCYFKNEFSRVFQKYKYYTKDYSFNPMHMKILKKNSYWDRLIGNGQWQEIDYYNDHGYTFETPDGQPIEVNLINGEITSDRTVIGLYDRSMDRKNKFLNIVNEDQISSRDLKYELAAVGGMSFSADDVGRFMTKLGPFDLIMDKTRRKIIIELND